MISAFTGHFRFMMSFSIVILIHEFGHFFTAFLLGWKVDHIMIYPYGGCSWFDQDINVPLWQEFFVLVMGPICQILFLLFLSYATDPIQLKMFQQCSYWILIFNLLPVYPLDGGKLVQFICSYFFSYYRAIQVTIYLSWFIYICLFFMVLLFTHNLVGILIFFLLGISLWREVRQAPYSYQHFLLERSLSSYPFSKRKIIHHYHQMKRDTYHFIQNDSFFGDETSYLQHLYSLSSPRYSCRFGKN